MFFVSDIIKGVVLLRGGENMEIKITKYDKEVTVDNGSGTVEKYSVTLSKDGGAQNHPDLDRHEVVGKVTEFLYE